MNPRPSLRNHARAERQETMSGAPTGEVPPGGGLAIHHLLKLKAKRLISRRRSPSASSSTRRPAAGAVHRRRSRAFAGERREGRDAGEAAEQIPGAGPARPQRPALLRHVRAQHRHARVNARCSRRRDRAACPRVPPKCRRTVYIYSRIKLSSKL